MKKFTINMILFFLYIGNIGIIFHFASSEEFDFSPNQVFLIILAFCNLFATVIATHYFEEKDDDQEMKEWQKKMEELKKSESAQDK